MEYFLYIACKAEPIFYQLLYMSIIASVIGVIILLVRKIGKNKISSKWISRIWLIFIISLIVPTFIKSNISIYNLLPDNFANNFNNVYYSLNTFNYRNMFEYYEEHSPEVYSQENESNLIGEKPNTKEQLQEDMHSLKKELVDDKYIAYLPFVWLVIVGILLILYFLTYFILEIKIRKYKFNDENLNNILNKCKNKLHINKNVKIVKQDIINMPSIFGIFNVRILVNDKLLKLDDKQIEYVFMHELAHYKRKDNWLNLLITILRSVYFFNPLVFILLTKVKKDLEFATDELAMNTENREVQKEYAKTLVMLSCINSDRFIIQTLCLTDEKRNLEKRIDNIKFFEKFQKNSKIISLISVFLVIIIVLVFFTRNSDYMSRSDMAKLMRKNENMNNYMIKTTTSYKGLDLNNNPIDIEDITYVYRKDNIFLTKYYYEGEYESSYYENYNTNECISYKTTSMNINRINMDFPQLVTLEDQITKELSSYSWLTDNYNDYEYLGEDKINDKSVYVVEIISPTSYYLESNYNKIESNTQKIRFYIDKKTGLNLRVAYLSEKSSEPIYDQIEDYEYSFNTVTDNDVSRPNIYDYKDYEVKYGFIDVDELLGLIKNNPENNEDIINKYNSIDKEKFKYKFDHKLKFIDGKYQYEVSFNDYSNNQYYKFTLDFETNKVINYETNVKE